MKNNRGFTLIEMIMVVAIISLITTLAISKYGDYKKESARRLSISNQVRISQAVETFILKNEGGLNKLDSLIEYDTSTGSAGNFAGQYNTALNTQASVGGIYRVPKVGTISEDILNKNSGIHKDLAKILCVYYPTSAEVNALKEIGIDTVMRAWANPIAAPGPSGVKGEDDSYILIENGLNPNASFAIVTSNSVGRALAAINISAGSSYASVEEQKDYKRGARIYQEMGADITIKNDADNYSKPEDAKSVGVLLAFGLGENASLVGKSGGLSFLPTCKYLDSKYYSNYILLVRLNPPSSGYGVVTAEFVGVLDPCGYTVPFAKKMFGE